MKILRLFFIFISLFAFANQALATVSLSIKNEEIAKTKILFFGFDVQDESLKKDAEKISTQIKKNLKTTDLFEFAKEIQITLPAENSAENLTIESVPNFEKFSKDGIGAILIAQLNYDQIGNLEIRLRMWDVLDQRQLFGKFYSISPDNYQKLANSVADEIFKAITGEKIGHFSSQILYVAESGALKKRTKKISLINFDGSNQRFLTDGRDLVITPIFSKKRDEIFYVRYFDSKPQIFSLDVNNLRTKKLSNFRITTFAPSAHPKDENLVLLSAISEGNSDIYEVNISNNEAKRLTKTPAIDTTASYSPDGKLIAFSSDRDSGQQIYIMDVDGAKLRRVSSGLGTYSKPIWSPDGKFIAFTRIKGGQFFIGIISPDGEGEKLLTSGYLVEGAKWSPNGRYLIFAKKKSLYGQNSISRLHVIDIVSGFEFELPTPQGEGASDPDWVN